MRVLGVVLLATLAIATAHLVRVVSIGVAYTAKMLCPGVFVAGRDPHPVLADWQVEDLAILRHVSVSVHPAERSVTATALGLISRQAAYRPGLGRALVGDGPHGG